MLKCDICEKTFIRECDCVAIKKVCVKKQRFLYNKCNKKFNRSNKLKRRKNVCGMNLIFKQFDLETKYFSHTCWRKISNKNFYNLVI